MQFIGIIIFFIVLLRDIIKEEKEYRKSQYYNITKLDYRKVKFNAGNYGEYLIYKHLKAYESNGARFLFNVYLPMDNDTTTEIDVLMIAHEGIFVFESKNYSGWIFGSEGQKNWTQTLPAGNGKSKKVYFYNPVKQNQTHIRELKKRISKNLPIWSVIVFSQRCTLKKINIVSKDISVIKRNQVLNTIKNICNNVQEIALSDNDIEGIYNLIYPYSQTDETVRKKHIESIKNRQNQP